MDKREYDEDRACDDGGTENANDGDSHLRPASDTAITQIGANSSFASTTATAQAPSRSRRTKLALYDPAIPA